jgi:hypothetical protein
MTNFSEIIINILKFLARGLFYTWWIFAIILGFLAYQASRRKRWVEKQAYILLQITVPKENEKSPLAAEMMFASLHGIYKHPTEKLIKGTLQEHISFEIVSFANKIKFYVWVPTDLQDFIEGQVYAQYPDAEICEVDDYTKADLVKEREGKKIISTELVLNKSDIHPIKTFLNFEVDTLAGITATLSKLEESGEQAWIQILIRPSDEIWQDKALSYIESVRSGEARGIGGRIAGGVFHGLGTFLNAILYPEGTTTDGGRPSEDSPKLSSAQETALKAVEEKASKLGFETKIRISYVASSDKIALSRIRGVVGTFKQYTTVLNGFKAGKVIADQKALQVCQARSFLSKGFILNIEELASIFHLPNITVETPTISWTASKKGEPPENLPIAGSLSEEELTVFAQTNFRHMIQKFGIKTDDRRRHMYIIGKTGTGKTTLLENMVISNIRAGKGVAVVDPHGDFVDMVLDFIPTSRINDIILVNPEDRSYPVAFNPLEAVDPDYRGLVASGLISIFQKIWAFTWGPRLEHILRNTILALLDYPASTMLGITRMLEDKKFRKKVVKRVTDPVVKSFWTREFAEYNEKFRTEAIAPIQNKVGQFLSTPTIRNIVGQPKSTFDMREIMDEGKILLIKLAQGVIGEDNSSLLGAMLITKIQLAVMSRVDIPEERRRDFYLYVDEFQNFATESFAKILSEARKYHLSLTLANQYIAQMPDEVREAVFGNVGTLVNFRVGAHDAPFLAKELAPIFDETDVVNLDKYNIYLKMAIDGVTSSSFSAHTLPPPQDRNQNREKIIKISRERHSKSRDFVEEKIAEWAGVGTEEEVTGESVVTKTLTKGYKKIMHDEKTKERIEPDRIIYDALRTTKKKSDLVKQESTKTSPEASENNLINQRENKELKHNKVTHLNHKP